VGIYVGQEYPIVPSIKILGNNFLAYLSSVSKEHHAKVIAENDNGHRDYRDHPEEELEIVGKILKILRK